MSYEPGEFIENDDLGCGVEVALAECQGTGEDDGRQLIFLQISGKKDSALLTVDDARTIGKALLYFCAQADIINSAGEFPSRFFLSAAADRRTRWFHDHTTGKV